MDPIYNEYEKLGGPYEGSFATIYKVRHLKYGYVRALKVLNGSIANESDKKYQTFLKECELLLKVGNGCHPNIVRIFQPRLINNQATVEMDFINGLDLEEYLSKIKFMTIEEVYKFIRQIGGALAYCHRDAYLDQLDWDKDNLESDPNDGSQPLIDEEKRKQLIQDYRIIHNDLHSRNVMRRRYDGNFFLLDFGLAIQNGAAVKSSSRREGAPEYKSPEKWEGAEVETPQNDIYSFGALLYEVLTGLPPFPLNKAEFNSNKREKAIVEVMDRHLNEVPAPIEPKRKAAFEAANPGKTWHRDYPEWLDQMVMKCLAKKPQDRYADAKELMEDFNRHLAKDNSIHGPQVDDEKLNALKTELEKANATITRLNTKCRSLESDLEEAKKTNPSRATNDEIAVANKRAAEAEQRLDVLQIKLADLEKRLGQAAGTGDVASTGDRSFLKIVLWAILGIAVGIFLGIASFNLFMDVDNNNDEASVNQVEMVDEATAPADEATAPADEATAPADEATAPADEAITPADEGISPALESAPSE